MTVETIGEAFSLGGASPRAALSAGKIIETARANAPFDRTSIWQSWFGLAVGTSRYRGWKAA
jgi:hypothetical protein